MVVSASVEAVMAVFVKTLRLVPVHRRKSCARISGIITQYGRYINPYCRVDYFPTDILINGKQCLRAES